MTSSKDLFLALKSMMPQDFPIKFSYIDLVTSDGREMNVTKNTAAVYFRAAGDPEQRDVSSGRYLVNQYRVVINVFTDRGEAGVLSGIEYCDKICDAFETLFNKQISISTDTKVYIIDCQRMGSPQYVGPTKQGIASFSLNFLLKFY